MIIGLDKKKYRKRLARLWILTLLLTVLTLFFLAASNGPNEFGHDYSVDLKIASVATLISLMLLFALLRLKKHTSHAISFENGELNDFTKIRSKIRGLKVEQIDSISRWAHKKKVNRYRIVVNFPSNKTKSYFISDTFVDTDMLLKLAESVGNEIAKRKATNKK